MSLPCLAPLSHRVHADRLQEGIPDIVFGSKTVADDGSGRHVYTPRAILEFKRPGIVEGLLPVFGQYSTFPWPLPSLPFIVTPRLPLIYTTYIFN